MTLIYLGIIIVLLQSYMKLQRRHKYLVKEHTKMMEMILTDIDEIKKCTKNKMSK